MHIAPILQSLHWLPITYHVQFKILVTMYKVLHGLDLSYLQDHVASYVPPLQLHSFEQSILKCYSDSGQAACSHAFSAMAPTL